MRHALRTTGRAAVVALFAATLVATPAYDLVRRTADGPSPVEARPEVVDLRAAARLADGSLTRWFDFVAPKASTVADYARVHYGCAAVALLHATTTLTVRGSDGVLYPTRPFTYRHEAADVVGAEIASKVAAVARRFAERGVRVVFCPVPVKAVVHGDDAPATARGRPELYAAAVAAVRARGVDAVDLLPALRAARAAGVRVFPRTDGHWTAAGALVAAEEAARTAGLFVAPESRRSRLAPKPAVPDVGSELATSGFLLARSAAMPYARTIYELGGAAPDVPVFALVDENGAPFPTAPLTKDAAAVVAGTSYSSPEIAIAEPGFGALFAHAIDRPTRVIAAPGAGPAAPLWGALQIAALLGSAPPVLLWEMPGVDLFDSPAPLANLGIFFGACPPLRPAALRDVGADWTPAAGAPALVGAHRLEGATLRYELAPGLVAHDGAGAVTLRLRGRVLRGDVAVTVDGGGSHETYRWTGAVTDVWLPILARRPTDRATLALYASATADGPAEFAIDGAELVADVRADAAVAATLAAPTTDADGRTRVVATFATPASAPRELVVVRFAADGGAPADVAFAMTATTGAVREWSFPRLSADAVALLDPTPLGAPVARVEVVFRGGGRVASVERRPAAP
jgi:hypothetical protein